MNISPTEQKIIEILRDARPFEIVEITKDQLGRLDHYIVKRSQKVVLRPERADVMSG